MSEQLWTPEARVERVRKLAARVYDDVTNDWPRNSVREVMHAMALATATIICENHKGIGRQRATYVHAKMVEHHVQKG